MPGLAAEVAMTDIIAVAGPVPVRDVSETMQVRLLLELLEMEQPKATGPLNPPEDVSVTGTETVEPGAIDTAGMGEIEKPPFPE